MSTSIREALAANGVEVPSDIDDEQDEIPTEIAVVREARQRRTSGPETPSESIARTTGKGAKTPGLDRARLLVETNYASDKGPLHTRLMPLNYLRVPANLSGEERASLTRTFGKFGTATGLGKDAPLGRYHEESGIIAPAKEDFDRWFLMARSQAQATVGILGIASYFSALKGSDTTTKARMREYTQYGYHVGIFPFFRLVEANAQGEPLSTNFRRSGYDELYFTSAALDKRSTRKALRSARIVPATEGVPEDTKESRDLRVDGWMRAEIGYGSALELGIRLGRMEAVIAQACAFCDELLPYFAPVEASGWTPPTQDTEFRAMNPSKNQTIARRSFLDDFAKPLTPTGPAQRAVEQAQPAVVESIPAPATAQIDAAQIAQIVAAVLAAQGK